MEKSPSEKENLHNLLNCLQDFPATLGEIVQFNQAFRYEMTFVDVR